MKRLHRVGLDQDRGMFCGLVKTRQEQRSVRQPARLQVLPGGFRKDVFILAICGHAGVAGNWSAMLSICTVAPDGFSDPVSRAPRHCEMCGWNPSPAGVKYKQRHCDHRRRQPDFPSASFPNIRYVFAPLWVNGPAARVMQRWLAQQLWSPDWCYSHPSVVCSAPALRERPLPCPYAAVSSRTTRELI